MTKRLLARDGEPSRQDLIRAYLSVNSPELVLSWLWNSGNYLC
jgi:hypothetical protein